MTFTVSPWLVWAGLCLALFGVWFVVAAVGDGLRQLWAGVRRDRVAPLLEDDEVCGCCVGACHYGVDPEACGQCGHPEPWHTTLLELPPERSWEQMTSHQYPLDKAGGAGSSPARVPGLEPVFPGVWVDSIPALAAPRERRPLPYEAEARAHYVAMGFEFPSGLMARVREAAQ